MMQLPGNGIMSAGKTTITFSSLSSDLYRPLLFCGIKMCGGFAGLQTAQVSVPLSSFYGFLGWACPVIVRSSWHSTRIWMICLSVSSFSVLFLHPTTLLSPSTSFSSRIMFSVCSPGVSHHFKTLSSLLFCCWVFTLILWQHIWVLVVKYRFDKSCTSRLF